MNDVGTHVRRVCTGICMYGYMHLQVYVCVCDKIQSVYIHYIAYTCRHTYITVYRPTWRTVTQFVTPSSLAANYPVSEKPTASIFRVWKSCIQPSCLSLLQVVFVRTMLAGLCSSAQAFFCTARVQLGTSSLLYIYTYLFVTTCLRADMIITVWWNVIMFNMAANYRSFGLTYGYHLQGVIIICTA